MTSVEHYCASVTRHMINFRASATEKEAILALVAKMSTNRNQRYAVRGGWIVAVSDVIRWGLEALARELAADQAAADAAEYNAKHPARKPATSPPAAKPKAAARRRATAK